MTLKPLSFALAGGIVVSLTLFGISWHAMLTNQGYEFVQIWEDMHFWYGEVPLATPLGSIVSLIDGFVHGFVYVFIFAWLYNFIDRKIGQNVKQ